MVQAYDAGMMARIMPKIQQWEANTGRKITPQMLEAMMKAELSVAADNAARSDAQAKSDTIRQQELDMRRDEAKKAASAAKVGGVVQTLGTAGNMYLTAKALGLGAKTVAPAVGSGATATGQAINAAAATEGIDAASALSSLQSTGQVASNTSIGAQAAANGASTAAPAVTSAASTSAAAEGGAAVGAGAGSGTAAGSGAAAGGAGAGSSGAGAGVGTYAAYATGGYYAHKIMDRNVQPLLEKSMSHREAGGVAHGVEGTSSYIAGHISDKVEEKYGKRTGDVVNFVLDPVGFGSDVLQEKVDTVICTELRRQGEITDTTVAWCRILRRDHVSDSTYVGYIAWATPVVKQMRKGGTFNRIILPFAHALVRQWVNIAKGRDGSMGERAVYRVAYWASRIAYRLSDERAMLHVRSVEVK